MLAEVMVRLQRPGKPQRYAMDTAHRQAIENYLALMTRGYGLPQLHRQATPQINQQLGGQAPLFHSLLQSMLQNHDDAAPNAALDVWQEHGGQMPDENEVRLLGEDDPLGDLLTNLSIAGRNLRGEGPVDIRSLFHPEHTQSDPLMALFRRLHAGGAVQVPSLHAHIAGLLPANHPLQADLNRVSRQREYGLGSTVEAHDISDRLSEYPFKGGSRGQQNRYRDAKQLGGMARDFTGGLLRSAYLHLIGHTPLDGNNG